MADSLRQQFIADLERLGVAQVRAELAEPRAISWNATKTKIARRWLEEQLERREQRAAKWTKASTVFAGIAAAASVIAAAAYFLQ